MVPFTKNAKLLRLVVVYKIKNTVRQHNTGLGYLLLVLHFLRFPLIYTPSKITNLCKARIFFQNKKKIQNVMKEKISHGKKLCISFKEPRS